jgi:hypothetical protein
MVMGRCTSQEFHPKNLGHEINGFADKKGTDVSRLYRNATMPWDP